MLISPDAASQERHSQARTTRRCKWHAKHQVEYGIRTVQMEPQGLSSDSAQGGNALSLYEFTVSANAGPFYVKHGNRGIMEVTRGAQCDLPFHSCHLVKLQHAIDIF